MIKALKPIVERKIWGGAKLQQMKQLSPNEYNLEPIGETWEIFLPELPYLVKLIDTSDVLSIQVHPDDQYARLHENSLGKTECWLILEAEVGAGIYLGLKPNVTKERLKQSLDEKKAIDQLLNFYQVKAGDFFYVPAGSIHAIGKGITQNSGITYRVWDWDRTDSKGVSRELHVEKSLDVISFSKEKNTEDTFLKKQNLFELNGESLLCQHSHFNFTLINLEKNQKLIKSIHKDLRPTSILNLNGAIKLNGNSFDSYQAVIIVDESQLEIEAQETGSLILVN